MKIFVIILALLSSLSVWADFTAEFNSVKLSIRQKITDAYRAELDAQLVELRSSYLEAYTKAGGTLTDVQRQTLTTEFDNLFNLVRTAAVVETVK